MLICNSAKNFLDTNVLLRYANGTCGEFEDDVRIILDEAAEGRRTLWISHVLFAELRPSSFVPGKFSSLADLVQYIRGIAEVVTPDPNTMLMVARLRDLKWARPKGVRQKNEKSKSMSLGDGIHLASALYVKDRTGVADLEFLTFDDGKSKTSEIDPQTKSLSILRLQEFTDGIASNPDVLALIGLPRVRPILRQASFALPASEG